MHDRPGSRLAARPWRPIAAGTQYERTGPERSESLSFEGFGGGAAASSYAITGSQLPALALRAIASQSCTS